MPRFFIEVPHDSTTAACNRAIEVFLRTGSHFLARADWGCLDGEHKAWFIIDVPTKHEAVNVVPGDYRANARVVQLTGFILDDTGKVRRQAIEAHQG
jgi:hypothetical protein